MSPGPIVHVEINKEFIGKLNEYQEVVDELVGTILKLEGELKMAKRKSPFKTGRAKLRKGGGSGFLGLKDGESFSLAPLVGLADLVSADMHEYWDIKPAIFHPCIGRNCPGCKVENEPRFKAYLPVLTKDRETKIYPFTISVYNQLESLEDELIEVDENDSLKGFVVKISRKGGGMSTRYTVLGLGKRLDVDDVAIPDFVPGLGPDTEKAIWELLEENGYDREAYKVTKPAAKSKKEAEDEILEDDDDDWGDA